MTQGTIFDAIAARQEAERGINLAAGARGALTVLETAKQVAVEMGRRNRFVNADDVQRGLIGKGYLEHDLGNAAGSVFRNRKLWRYTGNTVQSERVSSHGRLIRVWEFIGI